MMRLADVGAFETYETCRYELLDLLSQVDHVLCLKRCSELCNTIDWKFCLGKVGNYYGVEGHRCLFLAFVVSDRPEQQFGSTLYKLSD